MFKGVNMFPWHCKRYFTDQKPKYINKYYIK